MSPTTAAIIGAAIGAGGAVTAQITTAIATAKRERSRLQWEKERQDREWKLREEERWLAEKRELYASFGAAVDEFLSYISTKLSMDNTPILPPPELPNIEPLNRIKANIELMAPEEVSRSAGFCVVTIMSTVWAVNSEDIPADRLKGYSEKASRTWRDVHQAMRRDLHGDRQRLNLPMPKNADRPPNERRLRWTRWWRPKVQRRTVSAAEAQSHQVN